MHLSDVRLFFLNISRVYTCSLAHLIHIAFHIHGIIKDNTKILLVLLVLLFGDVVKDDYIKNNDIL